MKNHLINCTFNDNIKLKKNPFLLRETEIALFSLCIFLNEKKLNKKIS